jgi:hypothetical protein
MKNGYSPLKCSFTFFHERFHAFLLIFCSKAEAEDIAFELDTL